MQKRERICLLAALIFAITAAVAAPSAQPAQNQNAPAPAGGEQIFANLVKHNELRNTALQQYSATRTYSVSDVHGKVHAKETVRMEYTAPDKKTFITLDEEGSVVVRHLVLNRLMESEALTAAGQDHRDSAITPANYTFQLLGEEDLGSHHCFIVEAVPKRKDKYLFEGKVWIDSREFAIVKIAGHPAKNLSFWITKADFVRRYEKVNNFWLPQKDETTVDVRLYGRKILSIEHHIDTVNRVLSSSDTVGSSMPACCNAH
jgi:outer membrane lipoprotein-sorting protein